MLALLADADGDTRALYRDILELEAWQVQEAGDGRVALAKAIASPPDILISEIRLPGMSGLDLCRAVRKEPLTAATSVVIVTADAFASDVERVRGAGADAVLVKPCLPDTLAETVRTLVDSTRRLANELRESASDCRDKVARSREILESTSRSILDPQHRTPLALACPQCRTALVHVRSFHGGVGTGQRERWDVVRCPRGCGDFEFRVRTGKLRRVV